MAGSMHGSTGKLVLIIGPSGVGKSVILQRLRNRHPEYHFPRSATTRQKRPGESSQLYNFVSDAEFDALIENSEVLEWALVHGGARYGTLIKEILPHIDAGETVVREVDVQGFESIRKHELFSGANARYMLVTIFLLPESTDQLIAHIQKRAPMNAEELARRLKSMEKELAYADLCSAKVMSREGKLNIALAEVERVIAGESLYS